MQSAHDETLHLRLPASLRADLDGAARASGGKLSPIALGLRTLSSSNDDKPLPPAASAGAVMPAAA